MAVQIVRPEPVSTQRIRQRLRPVKPAPPNPQALAAVREAVRRSKSVQDAIAAITAINAAWSKVSPATHQANKLLIAVLEFSDSIEEALATIAMLRNDGSLLEPLNAIQRFVRAEFPDA
ncbi:MAG: hypothetical protein H0U38_01540, partial [Chloroflexia bacterium]|nr:hypothetical protein [Chloroflexia bacterium]